MKATNKIDWRIVVLALSIVGLYTVHKCNTPRSATGWKEKIIIDTIHTATIDTIWKEKIKYVKLKIPTPDTIFITGNSDSSSSDSSFLLYDMPYKDSLLEAKFKIKVDGVLIEHSFNYKAKFPQYIYTRDTFRINTNTTSTLYKSQLFIGIEIGGNETKFNLSPKISLKTKRDFIYSYRYGLMDKSHNIGITKLVTFKKQSIANVFNL
jgi:hypothetical protein